MKYLSTILLLATVCHVYAFDNLQKGIAVSSGNLNHLAYSNMDYAVADFVLLDEDPGVVIGFYRENGKNELFAISSGLFLYKTDFAARKVASVRPLTRWSSLKRPPEILAPQLDASIDGWRNTIEYSSLQPYSGCMNQHPLRYGDLEEDGLNELVLYLNGELIVFSPQQGRTVFSMFADASDWYRDEPPLTGQYLESDLEDGVSYQYLSALLIYNGISSKAFRAYTKLYIDDYDLDGHKDIVTWQKIYVSNKLGEAAGFNLIRNTYTHYTRAGASAEYQPQTTDADTIRQWLADKQLTWEKGYPSTSECAGQAGQLIPEMHDPLLNDADVLK